MTKGSSNIIELDLLVTTKKSISNLSQTEKLKNTPGFGVHGIDTEKKEKKINAKINTTNRKNFNNYHQPSNTDDEKKLCLWFNIETTLQLSFSSQLDQLFLLNSYIKLFQK